MVRTTQGHSIGRSGSGMTSRVDVRRASRHFRRAVYMDAGFTANLHLQSPLCSLLIVVVLFNMGNEVSRARMLTVSSFLVNFGVQTYGMIATPNMKDIAEAVRHEHGETYTSGRSRLCTYRTTSRFRPTRGL